MIELHNVCKSYNKGAVRAVDDLTLAVPPGEIFGFLGPNGAGKTTTIKMIVGILAPDSGTIVIEGRDNRARAPGLQGGHRLRPRRAGDLRAAHRHRVPQLHRRRLRRAGRRARRARRPLAGGLRAGGRRRRPHPDLLARHAPEDRAHRRPARRAAGVRPRRAADRPGPALRPPPQGGHARPLRPRRHPLLLDPRHGGRRKVLRPHRHHPQGPPDRLRHAGRAAPPGRRIAVAGKDLPGADRAHETPPRPARRRPAPELRPGAAQVQGVQGTGRTSGWCCSSPSALLGLLPAARGSMSRASATSFRSCSPWTRKRRC